MNVILIWIIGIIFYLIGVFASIALASYLFRNDEKYHADILLPFSTLSWMYFIILFIVFIISFLCNSIYNPFKIFYNKCNKKFRKYDYEDYE